MKFSRAYQPKDGTCFVIMPFGIKKLQDGKEFNWDIHYKDAISPVITDIGMTPIRADDIYGATPLMERIWKGIQEAELIIADLTGRNPNVMYELGLAHVIWKRVILLTMNDEDIPSDLSPYVQIRYSDQGHDLLTLMRKLKENLLAARSEPKTEAGLYPLPGGGVEKIHAKIIAVVENFATVEVGDGRHGFLNSDDVSWTRGFTDLKRIYKIGDEVDGAFIVGPKGENKYSLIAGEENPWLKIEKEFPIGKSFEGQIINHQEHVGAFVKMKYGINGLIPQNLIPANENVLDGDTVEAITVKVNVESRMVDLRFERKLASAEVPESDDWDEYQVGQRFEGTVINIHKQKEFILINLPDGKTAMLHQAQMSEICRAKLDTGTIDNGSKFEVEIVKKDSQKKRLQLKDCF
ncbi:S1 RNA-binding domain-containing protein [candidate division KSB1 bacterium]|nr:S1 RNA-binding domain-containing protein [candidate division KSB1 bacterium]